MKSASVNLIHSFRQVYKDCLNEERKSKKSNRFKRFRDDDDDDVIQNACDVNCM